MEGKCSSITKFISSLQAETISNRKSSGGARRDRTHLRRPNSPLSDRISRDPIRNHDRATRSTTAPGNRQTLKMKSHRGEEGNGLASLRLHVSIIELIPQHRLVAHDQTETVGRKRSETEASSQPPVKSFQGPTSPPCWWERPGSAWPRCTGTPSQTSGRRRDRLLTCEKVVREERVRRGWGEGPRKKEHQSDLE